jgi:hypothetical protein
MMDSIAGAMHDTLAFHNTDRPVMDWTFLKPDQLQYDNHEKERRNNLYVE